MTMPLTRSAYEKLIAEDIQWLMSQPRSLERDHIWAVLQASADHEYGESAECVAASSPARTITLRFDKFPGEVVLGSRWAARPVIAAPDDGPLPKDPEGRLPNVTRCALCHMQVCVPETWTNAQIERYANGERPTGIESRWKVTRVANKAGTLDPERVPCESRKGFIHVVLKC